MAEVVQLPQPERQAKSSDNEPGDPYQSNQYRGPCWRKYHPPESRRWLVFFLFRRPAGTRFIFVVVVVECRKLFDGAFNLDDRSRLWFWVCADRRRKVYLSHLYARTSEPGSDRMWPSILCELPATMVIVSNVGCDDLVAAVSIEPGFFLPERIGMASRNPFLQNFVNFLFWLIN